MTFGLTIEQIQFISNKVVKPLKQHGANIYCYGSRATGRHHKFSDLDIMVESTIDLSTEINYIKEILTNSSFPLKVDIVQLKDFSNSYKKSYEKDKVLWPL